MLGHVKIAFQNGNLTHWFSTEALHVCKGARTLATEVGMNQLSVCHANLLLYGIIAQLLIQSASAKATFSKK